MTYEPKNSELVESLKEQIKNGEYSMDVHGRVANRIRGKFPDLSKKFLELYSDYSEDADTNVFPLGFLQQIEDAILESDEPVPEKDMFADLGENDSMDGIKI